jgi:hypothetical protein
LPFSERQIHIEQGELLVHRHGDVGT